MAIMMLLFIFICMLSLLGCSCTTTITAKAFDHITRGTCVSQVGGSNGEAEFRFNLNNLLSTTLSSNADHGYHNATYVGTNSAEKVYVSFLCRGDVTSDICKECVDTATTFAFQNCPHATDAVLWFDKCLYRISNDYAWIHPMANNSRRDYVKVLTGKNVITKPISRYNRLLAATMNKLVTEAAKADRLFTTKEAQVKGSNMTLYSLAQCTPTADCNQCLRAAVADIVSREDQLEGFFLYQNCNIRYQLSPFFKKLRTVAAGSRSKLILYIVAVVLALIVCACVVHVALGAYDIVRRRELETHVNTARQQENDGYIELLHFNLRTIQIATSNFSEDNKLGEGGFGEVFQGTLGNGTEIAVKKLSKSSKQGVKEFKNEVALVAKLQHRNLVRQLGFYLEGEEAILVYE